jgi:sugar (pentulose or hexulose) kinase
MEASVEPTIPAARIIRSVTLVGIDIGSSAVKAATFDIAGRQQRVVRVECPSGGEFSPDLWWAAVRDALSQVLDPGVEAVGICGRGGTNVLLDERHRVCGPSWDDGRARDQVRLLKESDAALAPQSLGLLSKAMWWRSQGNDVAAVCSAKDYAVFRLTGELVSDEASGAVRNMDAPPELIRAQLPWTRAGVTLVVDGLSGGVPVAVGWHDGAAATFGSGAAASGTAPVTLGTNAVYRVVTTDLPPNVRKYWDLTPGLTVTGGDILAAGRTFAWATSLLPGADASSAHPGAGGALFLPQALGRIAPDVRLAARAAWACIGGETGRDDLLRAVVEGVAFALRQVREWLAQRGLSGDTTFATGGGAQNPLQAQVLADVLHQPIRVAAFEEGCRGAALLGGVAAGLLSLDEARLMPAEGRVYEPDPALGGLYDEAFSRWVTLQCGTDEVPL